MHEDKREKHVARSMIQMTMALNNTVFDAKREVTCYTCHRGVAKAASTLLLTGDKAPTEPSGHGNFPATRPQELLESRSRHVAEQSARNHHDRTGASPETCRRIGRTASLGSGRFQQVRAGPRRRGRGQQDYGSLF